MRKVVERLKHGKVGRKKRPNKHYVPNTGKEERVSTRTSAAFKRNFLAVTGVHIRSLLHMRNEAIKKPIEI